MDCIKTYLLAITLLYAMSSCGKDKKIPLDAANWYQLNSISERDTTKGLLQLSDGVLDKKVDLGKGKLLAKYECYYEFKDLENVEITRVRLYDGEGSFAADPFVLYAKASATAKPVLLATFTGEGYQKWVEIKLASPLKARYLVAAIGGGLPAEMELYGDYIQAKPLALKPARKAVFDRQLGVNAFIWNLMQDKANGGKRDQVLAAKLQLFAPFTQVRDYVDWGKIEPAEGNYTFSPTKEGLWYYDELYKTLQRNNTEVLVCLKTLPQWFLEKYYPADHRNPENIPAAYTADLLDPKSYILQAKAGFQLAARYGSRKVDIYTAGQE